MGSPWYWTLVAAVTAAFAVVDLLALSRRDLGRPQGAAIGVYLLTWVVVLGLSLPVAPLGSLWWLFPAGLRLAVTVVFVGGQAAAGLVRAEQAVTHHEHHPPQPPKYRLTEEELHEAEEYDARWQAEDRKRTSG